MNNKDEQVLRDTYQGKVMHIYVRNVYPADHRRELGPRLEAEIIETGYVFEVEFQD